MLSTKSRGNMAMIQENVTSNEQKYKSHYLAVHNGTFPTKESFDMPSITNWFKRQGNSKRYSIVDILKMSAQGKCYVPAHIELQNGTFTLVSSSIILIDIDDDEKVTDPDIVLKKLKDVCAGLFFTSSHSEKQNRYRLVFQLDKPVRDADAYKYIFSTISNTLKSFGIPVDDNAQSPLQRVRTATKGYIVGNLQAEIKTAPILERLYIEKEAALKEKAERMKLYANREQRIYSVDELKEMAEKIGYVDDYTDWQNLGYSLKSYVQEGFIDDIEGFEVFTILCGGNDESKYWNTLKTNRITIGTFIHYAKNKGFVSNKYAHASSSVQLVHKAEVMKFDKYIPKEFALNILAAEQRILVKSPTGSGKTYSFITASKEIASDLAEDNFHRFYIFATPTIALTEQVSESYGVMSVKGETKELYSKVKKHIKNGGRVFSVTYDLALALTDMIETLHPHCTFAVMVDEVHRLTVDYSYRKRAIDTLILLEKKSSVKSYVALTGTPDAVLREPFDREIHIKTKEEKPPCQMWGAIHYNAKKEGELLLYQVIKQKADNGKKLLIFLQNKSIIERLHKKLLNNGVKAKAITSDGKSNNMAYHSLVKESKFPEDTQVILATSVIADGLSINNENNNYECIVYTSQDSIMFDVDTLRQCAHRFRHTYRGFYIFMQTARRSSEFLYNIEAAYAHDQKIAEGIVEMLKNEFSGLNGYKLYKSARVEDTFGVSLDASNEFRFNKMLLRHNVNEEKSKFYSLYRNEMIVALEKLMGSKPAPSINASELREMVDLSEFEEEIELLKEAEKLNKAEKMAQISTLYTPLIHNAFRNESTNKISDKQQEELICTFKNAVTREHYACVKELSKLADFETTNKIVSQVKNHNQIHSFKKRIESFQLAVYFKRIARNTASKKVYNELKKMIGKKMSKGDIKSLIAAVTKKCKCKYEDVKYMFDYFFIHVTSRTKTSRLTTLELMSVEKIAYQFKVSADAVEQCLENMSKNESSTFKSISKIRSFYA